MHRIGRVPSMSGHVCSLSRIRGTVPVGHRGTVAFMPSLATVAPAFVEMAHRIVWCVAATTGTGGRPQTRVLHPIWEWDGSSLAGWIATSPLSPKAADLAATPALSLTYWSPNQDTCTADCDAVFEPVAPSGPPGGTASPPLPPPSATTRSSFPDGSRRSRRASGSCACHRDASA